MSNLLEKKESFSSLPLWPIYLSFNNLPAAQISEYLPKLSFSQRKALLNMDLWEKDEIDVSHFSQWPIAYHMCQDEKVKTEFVKGEEFLLFLKAAFNVYTFDAEDPMYPDHDNYFLTDDQLLLFEFNEFTENIDEIRALIRHLYYELGVEYAYAHLFKMVSDDYLQFQEEHYEQKKSLLSDFGAIDYYDSLNVISTYRDQNQLDNFIKKQHSSSANLSNVSKLQVIPLPGLVPFKNLENQFLISINQIHDIKRIDYLKFNFCKLFNSIVTFKGSLKSNNIELNRIGTAIKRILSLGIEYVASKEFSKEGVLEKLDFIDLYRIGHTLIKLNQSKLEKALSLHGLSRDNTFLGSELMGFIEKSLEETVQFKSLLDGKIWQVETYESLLVWEKELTFLIEFLPFIKKFKEVFVELKNSQTIMDEFYLNYPVEEIDLEAILISSLANFNLGHLGEGNHQKKLGITIKEFKQFLRNIQNDKASQITLFSKSFSLDVVENFPLYLENLLKDHLEGYQFEAMPFEDFKHVGGPILLNQVSL